MSYFASTDPEFLAALESWLRERSEILVVVRYANAAGSKEFEFFTSIDALTQRLCRLPARVWIDAWRQPQLPIRGIVDDKFIALCLTTIPEGAEYLVIETESRTYDYGSWSGKWAVWNGGETHAELREHLADLRGRPVAVGPHPPSEVNEYVISAIVPDENGNLRPGAY